MNPYVTGYGGDQATVHYGGNNVYFTKTGERVLLTTAGGVTAGGGITITDSGTVITNSGVITLTAGPGISITGTAQAPIVANSGVLTVTAGTGVALTGTATNPIISSTSSAASIVAGEGIIITGLPNTPIINQRFIGDPTITTLTYPLPAVDPTVAGVLTLVVTPALLNMRAGSVDIDFTNGGGIGYVVTQVDLYVQSSANTEYASNWLPVVQTGFNAGDRFVVSAAGYPFAIPATANIGLLVTFVGGDLCTNLFGEHISFTWQLIPVATT